MSKKTYLALAIAFCLAVLSVVGGFYWHEQSQLGHFYLGVSGGNAQARLGNFDLGTAPVKNYPLPAGWYELQLTTAYYNQTIPVRLTPGTATVVDWQLGTSLDTSQSVIYELLPTNQPTATLSVTTTPERAQLQLSGLNQEQFAPWDSGPLAPGDYQLVVSLPGFDTLDLPLSLTAGYQLNLTIQLAQSN